MKLLLDTHALLWFFEGSDRMPADVRQTVLNADNACFVSMASIWETAIKISLGRLDAPSAFPAVLIESMRRHKMRLLHIRRRHIESLLKLPRHRHDPFDRMLAAQAIAHELAIVSRDKIFDAYGVTRIW